MLHDRRDHLISLARCLAALGPSLAADALIAAEIIPPLVALLGRWDRDFKSLRLDYSVSNIPWVRLAGPWPRRVKPLVDALAALARRSPAARRQLRDAGVAPVLRAIAADAFASPGLKGLCGATLATLGLPAGAA